MEENAFLVEDYSTHLFNIVQGAGGNVSVKGNLTNMIPILTDSQANKQAITSCQISSFVRADTVDSENAERPLSNAEHSDWLMRLNHSLIYLLCTY